MFPMSYAIIIATLLLYIGVVAGVLVHYLRKRRLSRATLLGPR